MSMKLDVGKIFFLILFLTLSVSEIALQLKFTNRTHFYELFRQKYGMTPQQWRKMQKSAEHPE